MTLTEGCIFSKPRTSRAFDKTLIKAVALAIRTLLSPDGFHVRRSRNVPAWWSSKAKLLAELISIPRGIPKSPHQRNRVAATE